MFIIDALQDLITIIPELTNLFLSGFIFMCVYMKLRSKQFDIPLICIWSLFISYLIKSSYSWFHSYICVGYNFDENLKILIYALTGAILPCVIVYIYKTEWFENLLLKINYQTINSDIFDDVIDYDKKTIMIVYLKDSNYYYIGTFSLREEKGKDSYISLIDYALMDNISGEVISKPDFSSSVVINLENVERIEVIYSTGSKTWEKLKQGNKKSD